jgi:predicted nucleic acid-binding protein
MILLDTDILIDIFRRHPPAVAWSQSLANQQPAVPGFVAMELMAGCHNKKEMTLLPNNIKNYLILWPSTAASEAMIDVFATARLTHALGIMDALIAATALAHSVPLHTFNQKHFGAVPNLQTIQPYVR